MTRIAIGGFQHETNTFAPDLADQAAFDAGGGWPPMVSGAPLLPAMQGLNVALAGFADAAQAAGATLIPTTWAAASPSGPVKRGTYEYIAKLIVEGIRAALPLDAVYLDLHGAMVAQHLDDGEGELLRRVRDLVGPQVPIVATLDLHANVTQQMLFQADMLVACRTYPHVDLYDTGVRAHRLLQRRLEVGSRPEWSMRCMPYLVPICWQCTDLEPARSLYQLLERYEAENRNEYLSYTPGFPAADFEECGQVIWAYSFVDEYDSDDEMDAQTDAFARAAAGALYLALEVKKAEQAFCDGTLYSPKEAVRHAMQFAGSGQPTVIADAQDNPGAGSNGDTTGMLRALLDCGARNAVLGVLIDPASAAQAHAAGVGRAVQLALGGKSGLAEDAPLHAEFLVEHLSDGVVHAQGPYYRGYTLQLGPSACLRIGDVRVVVGSHKVQTADQAMFRMCGIEPQQQDIVVVKSAVHFRADFAPIAREVIVATAPGHMPMRLHELPWRRLAKGMRTMPCGEPFKPV